MIGGKLKDNESIISAAIRECHEELGEKAVFDEKKIIFVMDFVETATSDANLKIHMHIFLYNGDLKGELTVSNEIASFMWFGPDDDLNLLSNTLKNEVIPYAKEKKYLY